MPLIMLNRASAAPGETTAPYDVSVDSVRVDVVASGSTALLEVPIGEHVLQVSCGSQTSNECHVTVTDDAILFFSTAPNMHFASTSGEGVTGASDWPIDLVPNLATPSVRHPADAAAKLRSHWALSVWFFGGGALLIGGWIWALTGLARPAASMVTLVGFVSVISSMLVMSTARKRRAQRLLAADVAPDHLGRK